MYQFSPQKVEGRTIQLELHSSMWTDA